MNKLSIAILVSTLVGSAAGAAEIDIEIDVVRGTEAPATVTTAPATSSAKLVTPSNKQPHSLNARCTDGSRLKLRLLDAKIPLKTDYGTIEIPVTDILQIDFATRLPEGVEEKVQAAIEKLGADDYDAREAASAELLSIAEAAYPSLVALMTQQDLDAEVMHRAEQLVEEIRKSLPAEELESRKYDTVYTSKSQIGGTIELPSLKVETGPFGQQQLKLVMLRRISAGAIDDDQATAGLPDPGSLTSYQNQVGKTIYFRVSAAPAANRNGYVWGTDVYTLDSTLSMAAVHAGLLQPGQTKVIGVTIVGPQNAFTGSTRNGITSGNWSNYPGGYKFRTKAAPARPAQMIR